MLRCAIFCFLWVGCGLGQQSLSAQSNLEAFRIISFAEFEEITSEPSEGIRMFNFWATWCAPCVKEMPYFQEVASADSSVELFFVSLDDGRRPEKVTEFIKRKGIRSPVYLLDDVDYNSWINKVDPGWSGAIPATLFVGPGGSRSFHEGELTKEELEAMINHIKH